MSDRVASGIDGLDELLGGGFPRGGLIVLAGNLGTGKTIFSAQFLYRGVVDHGEKGVYVSFAEDKDQFYGNTRALGFDFERLEREGHFSFLDMLTVREAGVSPVLELIIGKVVELGAKRLVIDSFSAMAQAFKEPHDARIVLHTILSRVARSMGCTTLLIVEVPHGRSEIGLGIEEFVADGIIVLRRRLLEGNPLRELEILKIRGSPTPRAHAVFTLKGGLRVFSGFKARPVEKPSRFKPTPDMKDRFSTGSPDLDEVLGGYPKGSTILFEVGEGVLAEHYLLVLLPTIWNFMAHGRSVLITPSIGVEYSLIKERSEGSGFTSEEIDRLLRMYTRYRSDIRPGPGVVTFKGEDIFEDFEKRLKLVQELMDRTGQPVLDVNGVDALVDAYGVSGALSYLKACITTARIAGGLCLIVLKPGYPRLASILASMTDVHLRFVRRHGAVLVYGVNPATNLHVLEMDVSEGYPMPKLTPII
jgi:KaiC/GvpD/RAD55 family RecA-like ATPase